jgi:NitT/TauT family transport system permease protein
VAATRRHLYSPLTVCAVLIAWEAGVRVFRVPAYLLPAPTVVLAEVGRQWRLLLTHAGTTIGEVLVGFLVSTVVGILLGLAVVSWRLVEEAIYPILISAQTIPKVAVAPLLVIWFGFGVLPKILIIFLVAIFPVVINTVVGLRMVNPELVYLIRSMGGGRAEVLRRVSLPMAMPAVFAGLKVGAALAVVGAIVGEFVGADRGLGYLLTVASGNMDAKLLFATLVVLSAFGLLFFFMVEVAEWVILPWNRGRSATLRLDQV